ncbi:MAG: NADH-quinone oxidoreductase subunit L [Acidobacteriota bacterium]|nr:NADH-quinone oxidoreductase subunit L [Acidobacteriota bacterium]
MLKALVLSPLIAAGIIGIFGRRWSERLIAAIGCGSVGLSMLLAFRVFFGDLWPRPPEHRVIWEPFFSWIVSGPLHVEWGFHLDALSGVFILFVTFVGFWIHVFAVGYMRGDPGYARFFAYMNLFMFMMLVLVLADNFLVMFVGWEGVGLCSYLLIGHYFDRTYAASAAKKAFIVNRIGDFGFALGIILIFATFGTLRFPEVMEAIAMRFPEPEAFGEIGLLTAIALLLFVGATGKSAQIPLYVWLPDAMAGPTPVSALIHAATMVTAGVYMVARCSELYARSLTALFIIAVIGGVTALVAATIGLAQWNIKKVLAYSTISQLGYMFLACGVGAFSAAIFHVVTHAFFKALLFLGAGSVIVALHHEEDMRRMGGLKRAMPITYGTMLFGWLAIAGLPPFSGFFSKDEILWRTWTSPALPEPWGRVLWMIGLATAILTAAYMTRLMVLTFEGEERFARHGDGHGAEVGTAPATAPRESPPVMTIPLLVLAALSLGGGWIGISEAYTGGRIANGFEQFVRPALARAPVHPDHLAIAAEEPSHGLELGLAAVTVLAVLVALLWARRFYRRDPLRPAPRLLENKYYVDEVYEALIVRPIVRGSTVLLWKVFDVALIDGAVNGVASVVAACGAVLRRLQTGLVRSYVVMFLIGALIVLGYFVFVGGRIPAP